MSCSFAIVHPRQHARKSSVLTTANGRFVKRQCFSSRKHAYFTKLPNFLSTFPPCALGWASARAPGCYRVPGGLRLPPSLNVASCPPDTWPWRVPHCHLASMWHGLNVSLAWVDVASSTCVARMGAEHIAPALAGLSTISWLGYNCNTLRRKHLAIICTNRAIKGLCCVRHACIL